MDCLPVELRRAVIRHLDLPILKFLRLTSKAWASLGEEYLIPPVFTSLPHRPDMSRLWNLSQHQKYQHRIRTLVLNFGEINEYHARRKDHRISNIFVTT
jgi:hypothetical protein